MELPQVPEPNLTGLKATYLNHEMKSELYLQLARREAYKIFRKQTFFQKMKDLEGHLQEKFRISGS